MTVKITKVNGLEDCSLQDLMYELRKRGVYFSHMEVTSNAPALSPVFGSEEVKAFQPSYIELKATLVLPMHLEDDDQGASMYALAQSMGAPV